MKPFIHTEPWSCWWWNWDNTRTLMLLSSFYSCVLSFGCYGIKAMFFKQRVPRCGILKPQDFSAKQITSHVLCVIWPWRDKVSRRSNHCVCKFAYTTSKQTKKWNINFYFWWLWLCLMRRGKVHCTSCHLTVGNMQVLEIIYAHHDHGSGYNYWTLKTNWSNYPWLYCSEPGILISTIFGTEISLTPVPC